MNKKIIISFIFLIIAILLAGLGWWPLKQSFEADLKLIQDKKDKITEINKILEDTRRYKEKQKEFDKIINLIPTVENVIDTVTKFEKIAQKTGLVLVSINFTQPFSGTGTVSAPIPGIEDEINAGSLPNTIGVFNSITVNLTVSGSYNDFKRYLLTLEEELPIAQIKSINFSSGKIESPDFSIVANVYYQ